MLSAIHSLSKEGIMKRIGTLWALAGAGAVATADAAIAAGAFDLQEWIAQGVTAHCLQLFGVVQPVAQSSLASVSAATANADPTSLVTVAAGLKAGVVTA